MNNYTGFKDHVGNKIYSDSLLEFCNTAPIASVTTLHLVERDTHGGYGIRYPWRENDVVNLEDFGVEDSATNELPFISTVVEHVQK
ncbi:hypothetical protein C1940_08800 [Lactiplantibacillus plantarum subsp. plantarum]|uniref:hypothetical protein n=1 Tax=Lactiplantibacillus plantarum TaxID=1590 RepID=UPI000CD34623|nr:hypothetical protein [Lactiplantibacillus plantarum]AUV72559.1 hypothetical protein C1940_08800 [Lactiplantibacillus plantarum subsp. plantarum]